MRTIALVLICSTFLFTSCPETTELDYGNPLLPAYTHTGVGSFGMMVNESDAWSTNIFGYNSPNPVYVNNKMVFTITESFGYYNYEGGYTLENLKVIVNTDSVHPGNLPGFEGVYGMGANGNVVELTVLEYSPNQDTLFFDVIQGTGRLEISETTDAGMGKYHYSGTFGFDFPSTDVSPALNLHYGRFDFTGYY